MISVITIPTTTTTTTTHPPPTRPLLTLLPLSQQLRTNFIHLVQAAQHNPTKNRAVDRWRRLTVLEMPVPRFMFTSISFFIAVLLEICGLVQQWSHENFSGYHPWSPFKSGPTISRRRRRIPGIAAGKRKEVEKRGGDISIVPRGRSGRKFPVPVPHRLTTTDHGRGPQPGKRGPPLPIPASHRTIETKKQQGKGEKEKREGREVRMKGRRRPLSSFSFSSSEKCVSARSRRSRGRRRVALGNLNEKGEGKGEGQIKRKGGGRANQQTPLFEKRGGGLGYRTDCGRRPRWSESGGIDGILKSFPSSSSAAFPILWFCGL